MDHAQLYIEKYKKLEAVVRKTYGLEKKDSISYFLKKQDRFQRYYDDISFCQQVRNFMQHERTVNGRCAVEPNEAMLEFIDSLIAKIENRKRCRDICIRIKDVTWCSPSDHVKAAIRVMREKGYTHIPIFEDGRLVGVFDENSLFSYVADKEIVDVDGELRFSDIRPYLSIRDREMETFIFVKASMYVDDLEDEVQRYFAKNKRVGITFVTANGRENEPIQGIITPWDIISVSD